MTMIDVCVCQRGELARERAEPGVCVGGAMTMIDVCVCVCQRGELARERARDSAVRSLIEASMSLHDNSDNSADVSTETRLQTMRSANNTHRVEFRGRGQTGQLPRATTTRGVLHKTVKIYYLRKHKNTV